MSSEMTDTPERPSDELVARVYAERHPHAPRAVSLPDKFRKLLELQKIAYEIMRSRGVALRPWEKPWDVEP
jgi:hypothetical protein